MDPLKIIVKDKAWSCWVDINSIYNYLLNVLNFCQAFLITGSTSTRQLASPKD